MTGHLFFLNLLAAIWLIIFSPVAVRHNANHTVENFRELRSAQVIDTERLAAFAEEIDKPAIATNEKHFVNWLNDARCTNYLLVFPAFMVFLINAFFLLRMGLPRTARTSPNRAPS